MGPKQNILYGGLAQLVRAPASHAGGHWFESSSLHHVVADYIRGGVFLLSNAVFCVSITYTAMAAPFGAAIFVYRLQCIACDNAAEPSGVDAGGELESDLAEAGKPEFQLAVYVKDAGGLD